jgi:hypothetical protein
VPRRLTRSMLVGAIRRKSSEPGSPPPARTCNWHQSHFYPYLGTPYFDRTSGPQTRWLLREVGIRFVWLQARRLPLR